MSHPLCRAIDLAQVGPVSAVSCWLVSVGNFRVLSWAPVGGCTAVSLSLFLGLDGSDIAVMVRLMDWLMSRGMSTPKLAVTVRWAGLNDKGLLSIETLSPVVMLVRVNG